MGSIYTTQRKNLQVVKCKREFFKRIFNRINCRGGCQLYNEKKPFTNSENERVLNIASIRLTKRVGIS